MNLKKMIFINSILIFLLCFLTHFLYSWFPNPLFALFFPVNESIWEHMKMLYTTILIYSIIEFFILKKFNINHHNFLLATLSSAILSIPIYLILYLPIYHFIGENMIITFIILFIAILITNYINYKILSINEINNQKIVSIIFIIIIYILMGFLTFKTPRKEIFFDPKEEKYGLNDYLIKK